MLEQKYIAGDSAVNIAASIERTVASGRAAPGESLPPVRPLARHLGVSSATVAAAYRILRDRGVIIGDGRRGTRIRYAPPVARPREAALPAGVRDLASGNPDPALLPDLNKALRKTRVEQRLYGEELNDGELLRLAGRHFASEGIPWKHLTVVSGGLDGVERVLREHVRPGDRVIVEDPCFTGIVDLLAALALTPVPVAVDDEGIIPDDLRQSLKRPATAMILTPRAQNPTGAALSARRRQALQSVLRSYPDLLVIEDDHAGLVAGSTYETLVDGRQRWAVVRSVSKSLGPDLRLAVMAGDADTIPRVEGRQALGIRWVSHVLQRLVATLWRDGQTRRLLQRAERTYSERRAALLDALRERGIAAHGRSGLNVWVPVPEESAVVQGLRQQGWGVKAGERYRLETAPAIRITMAALTPNDAKRLADDLAEVLRARGRSTPS